jgi:hypothetical protein
MRNDEIIEIINRYCKKNNISFIGDYVKCISFEMNYLSRIHNIEPLIIVYYLNTFYRLTSKSHIEDALKHGGNYKELKFIPLSELVRLERVEKLSILLK